MTHHFRSTVVAFVCTLALAGTAVADDLRVYGTVENASGQAIAGAIVTATFGFGGTARSVVDTADASGIYEINTTTAGGVGGGVFQLTAVATGYLSFSAMQNVAAPNDGTPDTVTYDFVLQAGNQPAGDSLYVSGAVTAAAGGAAIAGAAVTVSILSTTGTQTANATTNAQGEYSIAMINQNAGRSVTITVSAAGYQNGTAQVQIGNASDGTADLIERDFALVAIAFDTLVVTGKVTDSANGTGLVGAEIIISTGGMNPTVLDTVLSGAGGDFAQAIVVQNVPGNISWRINMEGYIAKNGQTAVAADTAKIGTVALVAYTVADSIVYTVSGRVIDSATTLPVRNASVVIRVQFGADTVLFDTVLTNNMGNYTLSSTRMPYVAGDNSVTVVVQAQGYAQATQTATVPTSTSGIVMNFALVVPTSVIRTLTPVRGVANVNAKAYSINGRLIGSRQALDMYKAGGAVQPMIIRSAEGSVEKVVPVR